MIVVLLGHAGSGKLTIARQLAPAIGAMIVDNHYVCNPIFELISIVGTNAMPSGIWGPVGKVREAVMETIATLAPADRRFIFTFCASEEWPDDHKVVASMQEIAERRGSEFVPVRIICAEHELLNRIVSPERKQRLKTRDPISASAHMQRFTVIDPHHKNQMTLDVTNISAMDAALAIKKHLSDLRAL